MRVLRILVVDDDPINCEVLGSLFRQLNLLAHTVQTGREALRRFHQNTYALVLLDWHLPDLQGDEVCRQLRADGFSAPIIALSAATHLDWSAAGFDALLTKPYQVKDVRELCTRWLGPAVLPPISPVSTAPEPPEPSPHRLDAARLGRLFTGDPALMERVLEDFFRQSAERLQRCAQAIEAQSLEAVQDAAHALAGGAASLRIYDLTQQARALETLAEPGSAPDWGSVQHHYRALQHELKAIQSEWSARQAELLEGIPG